MRPIKFPYVHVATIGARGGADVDPKTAHREGDTVDAMFTFHTERGEGVITITATPDGRMTMHDLATGRTMVLQDTATVEEVP